MNVTFEFIGTYKSISNPQTEAGQEMKDLNRYYKMSLVVKKENVVGNHSIAIGYDLFDECYLIMIKRADRVKFNKIRFGTTKSEIARMKELYISYIESLSLL